MDCLRDFEKDMEWVYQACREQLLTYSPGFQQEALRYLDEYNVLKDGNSKTYICFLLPFWLQEAFRADREVSRKMALGNIYGLFYFLIQDAIIDAAPGEYRGDLLPLANLFYMDFIQQYQSIFPSNSPIWGYFKKYTADWAEGIMWERRDHWLQNKEFTEAEMMKVALKVATLKITSTGYCILSGNEDSIEPLSKMLDYMMVTLQLLDDWVDWKKDLKCGNCTYLLQHVVKYRGVDSMSQISEGDVRKALYVGNILEKVFAPAERNQVEMEGILAPKVPYMLEYHRQLLKHCREIREEVARERTAMMGGGFQYLLYKKY